jgi:hypothetical protein
MPRFNLADYETVEERIKRFYALYEDGRIVTDWESSYAVDGASPNIWVIKASVYLSAGDQANKLPKATGYASEKDGTGGANSAGAAMENCETSAIGRALANLGMSGNKRASREEMEKVSRNEATDYIAEADKATTVDDLRKLYTLAMANGAPAEVLGRLKDRATELDSGSEDTRTGRSDGGSRAKASGK